MKFGCAPNTLAAWYLTAVTGLCLKLTGKGLNCCFRLGLSAYIRMILRIPQVLLTDYCNSAFLKKATYILIPMINWKL